MKFVKTTLTTVAILLALPTLASAASGCLSHSELVETNSDELTAESACDDIGRAFVIGVTGLAINMQDDMLLDGHTYYLLTRLFLLEEKNASEVSDRRSAYMQILVASMLLQDENDYFLEAAARASHIRKKYYLTFVLNKYWEYNILNNVDVDIVENARNNLLIQTPLSGFQISCFVKADIPTLPVEQIFSSAQYEACLFGT